MHRGVQRQTSYAAEEVALPEEPPAAFASLLEYFSSDRVKIDTSSQHAFDVMLASQLGIGSYRALVEEDLDGHMVSVSGQLDLNYVPFEELVERDSMTTAVRYIRRGSDFHRLARFLESRVDAVAEWTPGARREV